MAGLIDMLQGLIGGGQGAQQQQTGGVMSPPGTPAMNIFGGGGIRDFLQDAAPMIAMMDPLGRNNAMAAAMMQRTDKRRADKKATQQANQTVEWLKGQGLDDTQAQLIASDPTSVRQFMMQSMKGQDSTSAVQNYQFLLTQGIDPKTAMDRAFGGGVTVNNMGNIPAGYQLETGPGGEQRMAPIPGSPAALEMQAAEDAEANRQAGAAARGGIITQDIDRILGRMGSGILPDTGIGAWLSGIPGTDAKDIAALLDTVKANIGFEELNRMRQQSPTGGALGNVTERELSFLQSVAGSLDQSQSPQQLRDNLNRLWNAYMDTIHGEGNFAPRRIGDGGGNKSITEMTDEELEAIINGNR